MITALFLASLVVPDADHTLAVANKRACAVVGDRRQVGCIHSGVVWSVRLPDDVPGRIADLHISDDRLCVRTEPSDALLCWVPGQTDVVERTEHVRDVAWGDTHLCALRDAGAIECWGNNDHGQLGDGSRVYRARPTPVGLPPAIDIAASPRGTCALLKDRTVRCWGDNPVWRDNRRRTPEPVAGLSEVQALLPGHVAVLEDGSTVSWRVHNDRPALFSAPEPLTTAPSNQGPRCHLSAGKVQCRQGDDPHWSPVPGVPEATELASQGGLACARDPRGAIRCWSTGGRLMLPRSPLAWDPQPIAGVPAARHVVIGADSACALTRDGDAWCWQHEPKRIELPGRALELQAGERLMCARSRRETWCWDKHTAPAVSFTNVDAQRFIPNSSNDVCVGGRTIRCTPVMSYVTHNINPRSVPFVPQQILGAFPCHEHRGTLRCWHSGGYPTDDEPHFETHAFDIRGLRQLVANDSRLCGVDRRDRAVCNEPLSQVCRWSRGARSCRDAGVEAVMAGVQQLALGESMGCALSRDGRVQCWEPRIDAAPEKPTREVALPGNATSVSVGKSVACAVVEDGGVWCWGALDGPIGGRFRDRHVGVQAVRVPWLETPG